MNLPELPSRYEALSRLGQGGGGEVWAVRDRYSGARYALKMLAQNATEREVDALVREAAALSGLEGLGVPRIVRFGRLPKNGRAFLVREVVEGRSLDDLITEGAEPERALAALASSADQLTVLHRAGLFHGDVKPANVIVEAGGRATLVDLGLAAPFREGGALAEGLTPHYAAPELFEGKPLTVRAEVYALGVTLCEALEAARSGSTAPKIIAELETVAARAMAASPNERYPSVDEFASALRRAAGLGSAGGDFEVDVALWPVIGIDGISGQILEVAHALPRAGLLRLSAPPGSGRTALLRRLGWSLGVEGHSVIALEGDASASDVENELSSAAASDGVFVLVDDADDLAPEARERLARARNEGVRLITVGGIGLGEASREIEVPPLDQRAAQELVRRAIPSLGDALLARVVEVSGARPGELRRLVRLIASQAVASTADIEHAIGRVQRSSELPEDALERAIHHLDRGRYNEALAALDTVASGANAVQLAIARARLELGLGDAAAALARLAPLSEAHPEHEELRLQLGRAHFGVGDSTRALELLEPLGNEATVVAAEALAFQGLALSMVGRNVEAQAAVERAIDRSAVLGAPRIEAVALLSLGLVLQRADKSTEALSAYQRSIAAAERASDAGTLAMVRGNLAGLLKVRGDVAGAIEHYEAALDMGRRSGRRQTVRQALMNLANLDLYLGRLARAQGRIEALEEQRGQLPQVMRAQLSGLHAELFARQGELSRAASHYDACANAFEALGRGIDAAEAWLESVLTEVRSPHPQLGELRKRVDHAREQLGTAPAHRPLLLLAQARLALAAGDEQQARAGLDEALSAARETSHREWIWRTLEARAELAEQGGQPLLARRDREEALAVLEEIGARLPRDLREVYWNDPRRAHLRAAMPPSIGTAATEFLPFSTGLRTTGTGRVSTTARSGGASQAPVPPLDQRLARILEVNAELAGEHDVGRLTARITDHAVELARAERGFVLLYDDEGHLVAHTSRTGGDDARAEDFSRSIAETVVSTREPLVALNAQNDSRVAGYASVHQMMLQSVACVPILAPAGRAIGALYVETRHRPGAHFERELPTLRAFADQVAIALESARLITENQRRADQLAQSNQHLEEAQQRLRELLGDRTEQLKRARQRLRDARDTLYGHFGYHGLVGTSASMRRVYALIERVKETDVPVLITGESGTGKEMVARAIHATSARGRAKMLGVNCGAIPENLLESELFGHVKGAFTGADRERKGLFRECQGGTILLDEIGETPAKMQAGLLRVLQERRVRPVGGTQEEAVDARVIFATNRDLMALVRAGRFREDLYYRIHVVEVRLPALRERAEDIPQLVDHFFGLFAARYKREKKTVSREALRRLSEYHWPGNVRELENVLLNAWVLSDDGELIPEDFDLPVQRLPEPSNAAAQAPARPAVGVPPAPPPAARRTQKGTISEHHRNERERILDALRACNWNRVKAAELSGIPRRTFYRRLREYGIQ